LTEEQNIIINKDIAAFVKKLDERDQSASYYRKRRNAQVNKVLEDIFLGKKAEYLVAIGMHKEYGFPLIEPDMEIYNGWSKGWEKDLPYVHVKSCSLKTYNYCNDYSWTFQYSNKNGLFGRDNIFNSSEFDLVAFVFMEKPQDNSGVIKAILPWRFIKRHLKDPKKESLIGVKKCVYYNDLVKDK